MTETTDGGRPAASPLESLAWRLGMTEGQLYTLVLGLVLGAICAFAAVPAELVSRTRAGTAALPVAPAPPAEPGVPAPAPTPAADPVLALPFDDERAAVPAQADPPPFARTPSRPVSSPSRRAAAPGRASVFARVPAPGAPSTLASAPDGSVAVVTDNADGTLPLLAVFSATGQLTRSIRIAGVTTTARGLLGVVHQPDGGILVTSASPAGVWRVDAQDRVTQVASLPDIPPCGGVTALVVCEPSFTDNAPLPGGIALAADGTAYVADAAQSAIWRVTPATGAVDRWYSSPDHTTALGSGGPVDLDVDEAGAVVFAVPLDPGRDRGGVYRVPREADGTSGTRALLLDTPPAAAPGAVSLAAGRLLVTLTGSKALVSGPLGGPYATTPLDGLGLAVDRPASAVWGRDRVLVAERSGPGFVLSIPTTSLRSSR